MSIIYTIVLCSVFIAFIAVTVEAVLSVARPKSWPQTATRLALVEVPERRTQDLPFVGAERRASTQAGEEAEAERLAA